MEKIDPLLHHVIIMPQIMKSTYNFSRIEKTYSAAINISGVGISTSHNSIHDAPHTGILFSCNDHLLEYNEIYNVATETDNV